MHALTNRLISLTIGFVLSYFAAYLGNALNAPLALGMKASWGIADVETWIIILAAIVGLIGMAAIILSVVDQMDERFLETAGLFANPFGMILTFFAFGALVGPFSRWGMGWNPLDWFGTPLIFFPVTATLIPLIFGIRHICWELEKESARASQRQAET